MSKEQIEEMARTTKERCELDNSCGSCHWLTCNECLAEVLYNAGYRKQTELAREIFEEIDKYVRCVEYGSMYFLDEPYQKLKKKYEIHGGKMI